MKKYKLQHQMPDFQSVDEISLKKSIESMIKIIEIKINTTIKIKYLFRNFINRIWKRNESKNYRRITGKKSSKTAKCN